MAARARGVAVDLYNIEKLTPGETPVPEPGSLVGFFYPTHGFNAPPLVLDFLRRFPRSRDNRVFFVNSRAGMKLFNRLVAWTAFTHYPFWAATGRRGATFPVEEPFIYIKDP